ncbi:MAG: O-antigen ligase family protein [Limisphaerales bacterium]
MKPRPDPAAGHAGAALAGLFGLLLGVALLKLGNPVILDPLIETPGNLAEWRAFAWPVRFGHLGLALVLVAAVPLLRWPAGVPRWWPGALAFWLGWQVLAALATGWPMATRLVLPHFLACGVCFAVGLAALARVPETRVFFLCLAAALAGVIALGFEQHFGGLAATRRMMIEQSGGQLPPEMLARLERGRIFSTLVYPNALAGALLLLLPVALVTAWRMLESRGPRLAGAAAGTLGLAGLACLVWSGSKAGWLLALGLGALAGWRVPVARRWRVAALVVALVAGLAFFVVRYRERLADPTSVVARLEYWRAAARAAAARPLFGLGPGGFKDFFARTKPAEAEMARLAHNDFLQQASDSGLPGALAYAVFVAGGLAWLARRAWRDGDLRQRAVWLGLLGWFAQGLVEFGLYLPATAWTAFALFGWLAGTAAAGGERKSWAAK